MSSPTEVTESLTESQSLYHQGDRRALTILWHAGEEDLKRYAMKLAMGRELVADQVLYNAFERLDRPEAMTSYNPERPFKPYAKRTIFHCFIDWAKRAEARNQPLDDEIAVAFRTKDRGPGPYQDEKEAINQAFSDLPEDCKMVVIAYVLVNDLWKMDRVAALTGFTLADCRRLYRKSLELMRRSLEARGFGRFNHD